MRVGQVPNNINFGKTIRVAMNENVAHSLVSLINTRNTTNVDVRKLQQDAKKYFDDTYEGAAVVCSPDNGKSFYILSGQAATQLHEIRGKVVDTLETICSYYDEGPLLDTNLRYIFKKENQDVNNLIRGTRENYTLAISQSKTDGTPSLYKLSVIG